MRPGGLHGIATNHSLLVTLPRLQSTVPGAGADLRLSSTHSLLHSVVATFRLLTVESSSSYGPSPEPDTAETNGSISGYGVPQNLKWQKPTEVHVTVTCGPISTCFSSIVSCSPLFSMSPNAAACSRVAQCCQPAQKHANKASHNIQCMPGLWPNVATDERIAPTSPACRANQPKNSGRK